jgi:putative transposase
MRFRFIEDRGADYPVTIMCDVLGVSPAGYYAWRARPESRRAADNRQLVDDIKRVHRDACERYGSPRIHAELRAQGRGVSRGRIERLMRVTASGPSWRGHGGCAPPTAVTTFRLPRT